ncbi:DNA repair protein RecN, partial [bacterium]
TRLDRRFQEIASLSNELTTVSGELARSLREAALSIEFNQEKLDEMRLRLSFLQRLMEKYKTDYRGLLELRENLSRFEDELFFNEEKIDKLEREIKEEKRLLAKLGEKLHTSRVAAKRGFEEKIEKNLSLLGMENADFLIEIEQEKEPTPFGFDRLEFFIRTNPGELPKPFRAVASGGEISRIMLACKSVISSVDNIPVMVFDEIDVGIGGRTANRVASMLKKISGEHQLIVVTHLPQIARMEGNHIRIEKITDGKRTNVVVKTLNKQEKEKELKRMLGVE